MQRHLTTNSLLLRSWRWSRENSRHTGRRGGQGTEWHAGRDINGDRRQDTMGHTGWLFTWSESREILGHIGRCKGRGTGWSTCFHASSWGEQRHFINEFLKGGRCSYEQISRHIGNMEKERLVNTVADTLSVADVKRSGDALENVNSEQLTHKLTR